MSELTTYQINESIADQIADLDKVINTLTADRNKLQLAAAELGDKPVAKQVERTRGSKKVVSQTRKGQTRNDHAGYKQQILTLTAEGLAPAAIAEQTGAPISYVYHTRYAAAKAA